MRPCADVLEKDGFVVDRTDCVSDHGAFGCALFDGGTDEYSKTVDGQRRHSEAVHCAGGSIAVAASRADTDCRAAWTPARSVQVFFPRYRSRTFPSATTWVCTSSMANVGISPPSASSYRDLIACMMLLSAVRELSPA